MLTDNDSDSVLYSCRQAAPVVDHGFLT